MYFRRSQFWPKLSNIDTRVLFFSTESETLANQCKLWRLSFSTTEKELLLHADGTLSEGKTCRKDILRLLKDDLEQLDTSKLRREKLETFSSYALKAIMLGQFSQHESTHWRDGPLALGLRYLQALMLWRKAVEDCYLEHHFIPGDNLLEDMAQLSCGPKEQKLLLKHIQEIFNRLRRA